MYLATAMTMGKDGLLQVFFLAYNLGRGLVFSSMTNSWAVEVQSGGKEAADTLASKYGFINLGQVKES